MRWITDLSLPGFVITCCDLMCAAVPRHPRPGLSTCLCLRIHRRHMRGGFPAGVFLLLLPSLPAVSWSDHQGVVFLPPTLQPGTLWQPASHTGPALVHLLALPSYPLATAKRRHKLPGHRIAGALAVTGADRSGPSVFTLMVVVNVIGSSRGTHLSSRRGSLEWEESRIVCGCVMYWWV